MFLGILVPAVLGGAVPARASWLFKPSYFSHEPKTGQRVNQFAEPAPSYVRVDETYVQSGYRHNQITIRAGGSADHMHIVETWGEGEWIRPYGEWLRPFRAGATPYGPWGNPQGPWTLPFDSWINPYGLWRPQYYPSPGAPYGPYSSPMVTPPTGPGSTPAPGTGYGPYAPSGLSPSSGPGPMPGPHAGYGPYGPAFGAPYGGFPGYPGGPIGEEDL